ncbi:hypothetical protein LY474_27625 [Myxococcus stipitatus]|uniref:hypothetical protein n=1 Tax=Myxococcus stipitatus TaxID=83455 RepID=UPI001F3F22E8|nr:hypothetical protein [Myxococcus stipitatus]MCE9671582.1 hypothetical protein [Myxococcus stipitatus]
MAIELLLSHADTHAPVLETGLEAESLRAIASVPLSRTRRSRYLRSTGNQNDLREQRWGLVVPEGEEGQRLLDLIAPLRELREREQGGHSAQVYRVRRGMDREAAHRWLEKTFECEQVEEEDRPRYLLILGDLDTVSLELQEVLSIVALVGRLVFPTDDGYRAYVAKVLRWAEHPSAARRAHPLFYTARDGSAAARLGHDLLMKPCAEMALERPETRRRHMEPPVSCVETGEGTGTAVERFLRFASEATPSVLLSLSHGLGPPSSGNWASIEQQRALQGALVLARGQVLTSEAVADVPFLPGGVWFGLACFSAGTPAHSLFAPWLQELPELNATVARFAQTSHHGPDGQPFIAALPQAALANPEGPLAVVGHIDLAWTTSFSQQGSSRHKKFRNLIEAICQRSRVGAALTYLLAPANRLERWQAASAQDASKAKKAQRRARTSDSDLAFRWLQYHDLASYVLLGDPAVHLPLVAPPP